MTDSSEHTRRSAAALSGLTRAIQADGVDDTFEHPSHDVLEAFVDGALDDADREWVSSHAELCAVCLDDIGDLTRMREALAFELSAPVPAPDRTAEPAAPVHPTRAPGRTPGRGWTAWAGVAAALVVMAGGAYLWMRTPAPAPDAVTATATPPPANPRVVDPLTADERARVDRALASGVLDLPSSVRTLARPSGTLLGEAGTRGATLTPVSPVGTGVASATPAFTWSAQAGATRYDIAVFDEQFNEVASAKGLTGTSWTPSTALPRGVVLSWQVTAHAGARTVLAPVPPQPEARFLVVDPAVAASADADRARLAEDPLALAVILAGKGLVSDAVKELERAATDPARAERARALLAELRGRR